MSVKAFERPRDDDTTTEAQFVEIKRHCLALLRTAAT